MKRAALGAALLALLGLGVLLRVTHATTRPAGPWIDEAYALRAARLAAGAPLFGTTPLEPADAGFVNDWVSNAYLRTAAALDRPAGGGMASVRALSIPAALLLLAAGVLLAGTAARWSPLPTLGSALLLATSFWLTSTGRWGWVVVATTAVMVLAAVGGIRAADGGSPRAALAAGALLGLAQYGSVASRLALGVPTALLLLALARRRRRDAALAALALAAALAVAAPLAVHLARRPERAGARMSELALWRAERPLAALGENLRVYAMLFAAGGDANERHGDPRRPVLPPLVTALALVGVAPAFAGRRAHLLLALAAGALLCGGLLAHEATGANAYRISPAAPFLLVLAGLGAEALLDALPAARRRAAGALLGAALLATGALEVRAFREWLSSPRTAGAFGGPERSLADTIRWEREREGEADVLLHPTRAARNAYVVDVLLAPAGSGAHALRVAPLAPAPEWRALPERDVLYADADDPRIAFAVEALGGRLVATERQPVLSRRWALFRIPRDAARRSARERLEAHPLFPARAAGSFMADEDGLYSFSCGGAGDATLDGKVLFHPLHRPRGLATVRLATGAHDLAVAPGSGALRITGPDGFAVDPPPAPSGAPRGTPPAPRAPGRAPSP